MASLAKYNMSDSPPAFEISSSPKLIRVRLSGQWSTLKDLEYITALGKAMEHMRKSQWIMAVDMREWLISEKVARENVKFPVILDRRNQVGEAWLVSSKEQAQHLDTFFDNQPFSPVRFTDASTFEAWIANFPF